MSITDQLIIDTVMTIAKTHKEVNNFYICVSDKKNEIYNFVKQYCNNFFSVSFKI